MLINDSIDNNATITVKTQRYQGENSVENCKGTQSVIFSEIVRFQGCKKRADIHSVSQAVTESHGLAKGYCEAQLQNMIDHGTLKNVKSHGAKS